MCVCYSDRDCTEGFCVIVLSAEACREKGHVLSSDHIVYYNHNRGGEIVRQKGVREERERKIMKWMDDGEGMTKTRT